MAGRYNGEEIGSKRSFDGGDYQGAKRPRQSRTSSESSGPRIELRLLIPISGAGAVIGKGGSNISELRQQYNASIQIPDSHGVERVVNTSASSIADISKLCGKIVDYISSENSDPQNQEVRLLIHKSQVGSLIGTKGMKIKELRESTGSAITVFRDCCPNSTDRICQIRGDNDIIVGTVKKILEILETVAPKGPVRPYDPNSIQMGNINSMYEYGGFSGSGGRQENRFGGNSRRGRGGMPSAHGGRFGNSGSGSYGGGGYGNGRNNSNGRNNFPSDTSYGGNFRSFGQSGTGQSYGRGSGPETSTKVTIPTSLTGSIIGRGGTRIRQIRQDCGAQIKIEEPEPGSDDRVITITGTQEQIQNAQFLLQRSVKMYSNQYKN